MPSANLLRRCSEPPDESPPPLPRFTICIPNYNYATYLGETLKSVLAQEAGDFEVRVSDNASTDDSLDVIASIGDPRIHVTSNRCNVGFAANLDRAARDASGELMIMLSSDDVMRPDALTSYEALFDHEPGRAVVVSATVDVIDSVGAVTGRIGPDEKLWAGASRHAALSDKLGAPVLELAPGALLERCFATMRNPFNFLATAYPRSLYEQVEGYGGGRLMNPDKWFHWRLVGACDAVYFVDRPLFGYRWHQTNQTAQQSAAGALKFIVDDYVNTFEVPEALLRRAGCERADVERAFVEHDIARHGLATLARGDRAKARRILHFGQASYPALVKRNRNAWILRTMLALGPAGEALSARAYGRSGERREGIGA